MNIDTSNFTPIGDEPRKATLILPNSTSFKFLRDCDIMVKPPYSTGILTGTTIKVKKGEIKQGRVKTVGDFGNTVEIAVKTPYSESPQYVFVPSYVVESANIDNGIINTSDNKSTSTTKTSLTSPKSIISQRNVVLALVLVGAFAVEPKQA